MTCVVAVYARRGCLDVVWTPGSFTMNACAKLAAWAVCFESINEEPERQEVSCAAQNISLMPVCVCVRSSSCVSLSPMITVRIIGVKSTIGIRAEAAAQRECSSQRRAPSGRQLIVELSCREGNVG
jgi:hypothetical protein